MHLTTIGGGKEETRDEAAREMDGVSIVGSPLCVVFADADQIRAARRGATEITLTAPFHVAAEDAYWVVPDDIGLEIIDILNDGDRELLDEALRDSVVVLGELEIRGKTATLRVDDVLDALEMVADETPHAEVTKLKKGLGAMSPMDTSRDETILALNKREAFQCTVSSAFLDRQGFSKMLNERDYVGMSWRAPEGLGLDGIDPVHVWSRRVGNKISVELVLFHEYEELTVVFRPLLIEA